jgi:predicted membrane protein
MDNIPQSNPRAGKIFIGVILLAIGVIMLLQNAGFGFPLWFVSWKVIVIIIGLFIGVRSNFRHPAWFIMVTVGLIYLIEDYYPLFHARRYLWPLLIILFGLWLIFGRSRSRYRYPHYNSFNPGPAPAPSSQDFSAGTPPAAPAESYPESGPVNSAVSSLDYLNATAVLGGAKKIVVSKNFQGGDILTFMGGAEINLVQADIQGQATLEITQIMGGIKLVVPANWTVISDMTVIMGGIDDKRLVQASPQDKILILKGTSLMGGLEIKSY